MPFINKKPQVIIGSSTVPVIPTSVPTVITTTTSVPAEKSVYQSAYSYNNSPVASPKVVSHNEYKYDTSQITTTTYPVKTTEYTTFNSPNAFFYDSAVTMQTSTNNIYEVSPSPDEIKKITYNPNLEIYSTATFVIIMMDIPGVSKENLHVELEKGLLKIYGTKEKPEIEELTKNNDFHTQIIKRLNEYYFCKIFQMPPAFSEGQSISCKLKDGELIIKLVGKEINSEKKVINIES